MALDPPIELRDVNEFYGEPRVLRDIDLTAGRGEVVVVIGPSGSGTSTLCRTADRAVPQNVSLVPDPRSERARDFLSKILEH